ncbi:class I SAM-dependent methyltransferase [Candidatus Fermentibacteria bacterium]|nr:class I SAM-dependent methyltransferase [Candidatus Fermentibacteria bacterium]
MTTDSALANVRTTCRICGSPDLCPVIDLGSQHIASIFVRDDVPPALLQPYPLELVRCSGRGGCGLVQLRHTIAQDVLYSDYGYRSGTNEIMRANLCEIVERVEAMVLLRPGDLVVDIGCNDGTLLDSYATPGVVKVGFDPAPNVARLAEEKGVQVIGTYFSFEPFDERYPGCKARVITSVAMLYDLENPNRFVDDVAKMLADDGLWVIELSYLPFMLHDGLYDTICHEHLEYYGLRQIEWMLERKGFRVHGIEFNDINGGSFRLFVRRRSFGDVLAEEAAGLEDIRVKERLCGLDTDAPYEAFCAAVQRTRQDLRASLETLKSDQKTVYVYGASTKGNTILQYCGIDAGLIDKAADRNPEKWGRHTLGTNIPIVSEEQARAEKPDFFLVLPWHFFDCFVEREADFLRRGGKFILPLPELRIVGMEDVQRAGGWRRHDLTRWLDEAKSAQGRSQ